MMSVRAEAVSVAGAGALTHRFTVPSWVIPGTYLENLHFLADKPEIGGVELLFFLYDWEIRDQFETERRGIEELRDRFSFTAHLPDLLLPEHRELVRGLSPLVRHFIIHPGPPEGAAVQAGLLHSWKGEGSFLLENTLPGRFPALLPYLDEDAGFCMDTGHLLLEEQNPADFLRRWGGRVKEIHLHGMDREKAARDGRLPDHRPLRAGEPWLVELAPLLAEFAGTVNLEVFSWEEAAESIAVLKRLLPETDTVDTE
jgi:hypothetical protein